MNEDFNFLVEQAMQVEGYSNMGPVIKKELLHYDILFALDKEELLDNLTFQGGTALRLCYGAPRLSEDLDFVGGKDFAGSQLIEMKNCIEDYIGKRYGLHVSVKKPAKLAKEPEYEDIKTDKWRVSVTTSPEKRDIPRQKIKLEICNVPAYTRSPQALNINYDFLPDGYGDTLIMTESLEEIMADKLISFVNTTKYVRNRDIWDLRWLKQRGSKINFDFILAKIKDYQITDYPSKLKKRINEIDEIIKGKNFHDEMSRFIPTDIQERTLEREKFKAFLISEIKNMLVEVKKLLSNDKHNGEFDI